MCQEREASDARAPVGLSAHRCHTCRVLVQRVQHVTHVSRQEVVRGSVGGGGGGNVPRLYDFNSHACSPEAARRLRSTDYVLLSLHVCYMHCTRVHPILLRYVNAMFIAGGRSWICVQMCVGRWVQASILNDLSNTGPASCIYSWAHPAAEAAVASLWHDPCTCSCCDDNVHCLIIVPYY